MSVRRPQKDCQLCAFALPPETHEAIYHAYQEARSYQAAVKKAEKLGLKLTEEEIRNHFQYHRPVQPSPRTRFNSDKALARAKALPERLQEIVALVSRVPALTGTQLAELLYWTGTQKQLASARNGCYRDLRRLVLENYVYKWYPPAAVSAKGTRIRSSQHRNGFYLLGRDAVPFIEDHEGYEPQRGKDWVLSPEDMPEQHEVFEWNRAAETIASLARQGKRLEGEAKSITIGERKVFPRFQPLNWYGPRRLQLLVSAPGVKTQPMTLGGLAFFGFLLPEQKLSVGAPFIYEYDDGVRPLNEVAAHLVRYVDLKNSGALAKRFPDLVKLFPPVLLIARDAYRVEQVRVAAQQLARKRGVSGQELPIIIAADQATVASIGLTADVWVSLWDSTSNPTRRQLVDVLLKQWKQALAANLNSTARLRFDAKGAAVESRFGPKPKSEV